MKPDKNNVITLERNGENSYGPAVSGPDVGSRSEDLIRNAPDLFHNIYFNTPTPRYPNWKPYFKENDTSLPWWFWTLVIVFVIAAAAFIWGLAS